MYEHYFEQVDKEKLLDRQASREDISQPFILSLGESRFQEPAVKQFFDYIERYSRAHHLVTPTDFSADHPVAEVAR